MVNITETVCIVVSLSVMSNSLRPHDHSSPGSSVHGDSPSMKTGVGCYALLQGIFPTQDSNQDPLHCRWILYLLSYQGSPGTVYTEHFTRTGENRNWFCLGCRVRMLSQSADSLKLKKGQRMWCQKKTQFLLSPSTNQLKWGLHLQNENHSHPQVLGVTGRIPYQPHRFDVAQAKSLFI